MECEILEQSDSESSVTIKASKAQLAAIKTLDYIKRVMIVEEKEITSKELFQNTEKDGKIDTEERATQITVSKDVTEAALIDDEIQLMCYDGAAESNRQYSNTMQTAEYLPHSEFADGCICCPPVLRFGIDSLQAQKMQMSIIYIPGAR